MGRGFTAERARGWVEPLERRALLSSYTLVSAEGTVEELTAVGRDVFFVVNRFDNTQANSTRRLIRHRDASGRVHAVEAVAGETWEPDAGVSLTQVNGRAIAIVRRRGDATLWTIDARTHRATPLRILPSLAKEDVVPLDNALYFPSDKRGYGKELWQTDGTVAGTRLVKDLVRGPEGSHPASLTVAGRHLYFTTRGPGGGIYRTDGTSVGTTRFAELTRASTDQLGATFDIGQLIGAGKRIYFVRREYLYGSTRYGSTREQLWYTDGSPRTTRAIPGGDLDVETYGSPVRNFAVIGTRLFFTKGVDDREVWATDGTAAGTRPVTDFASGGAGAIVPAYHLVTLGGTLLFILGGAGGATSNDGLWALGAGDRLTRLASGAIGSVNVVGGKAHFIDSSPLDGYEFVTDGTRAGTRRADGLGFSSPPAPWRGRYVYASGREIRVYDPALGTVEGTVFSEPAADGRHDASDRGLTGYRVWVDLNGDGSFNSREPSARTTWNGRFSIGALAPGTYTVHLTAPDGWLPTTPVAQRVTVRADETSRLAFGGLDRPAVVRGTVFNDIDGDRVRDDGEELLSGFDVYFDRDNDSRLDVGEMSATTDHLGRYRFEVAPGAVLPKMRIAALAGWRVTNSPAHQFSAEPGQTIGHDFGVTQSMAIVGNFRISNYWVGGNVSGWRVWVDLDRDGAYDDDEPRAISDNTGRFTFRALPPGNYELRTVMKDGYEMHFNDEPMIVVHGWPGQVSNAEFLVDAPRP